MGALGDDAEHFEILVWIWIYRNGPITPEELRERLGVPAQELDIALARLQGQGRVQLQEADGQTVLNSSHYLVPLGAPVGFEAALFDHYQAMVGAFCTKLDKNQRALPRDVVGGSTYSFDVWQGHPYQEEVYRQLGLQRQRITELWSQVNAYNREHRAGRPTYDKVTFYFGQNVRLGESDQGEEEEPCAATSS
jgi:hypothetical protein